MASLAVVLSVSAKPITGSLREDGRTRPKQGNHRPDLSRNRLQNLRAVRQGRRVFSAYELQDGTRIWIITEADRSVTIILPPEEY